MSDTFGDFFGSQFTAQECDLLAFDGINEKLLSGEAKLFGEKWFDYRFMHPTTATYLFAHLYSEGCKDANQVIYDVDKGKFMKNWKGKDFLDKKERGGFWKARQSADRMCMPYNYYIRFAIDFGLSRCWKRIPRPSQMYSKECIEWVQNKWSDELSSGVVEPVISHLRAPMQKDEQVHLEMQRWVCGVLKTRRNAHYGLSHYLFIFPIISEQIALQYFTVEEIQKAKRVAESL